MCKLQGETTHEYFKDDEFKFNDIPTIFLSDVLMMTKIFPNNLRLWIKILLTEAKMMRIMDDGVYK